MKKIMKILLPFEKNAKFDKALVPHLLVDNIFYIKVSY